MKDSRIQTHSSGGTWRLQAPRRSARSSRGTVRILHTLYPLGVAMAPGETHDPYKD